MSGPTREQVIQWAISSGTICGGRELVLGAAERLERLAALAYAAGQAAEREEITNMPGLNLSERQRYAILARGQQ